MSIPPPEAANLAQAAFPLQDFLGFEIDHGEGSATASLVIGHQHLNPYGMLHGSVPHALLDTAMGAAVGSVIDEGNLCATIEMQVRYVRGVSEGRIRASVNVIHAGRRIVHLEGKIVGDDDRVIATATSSFAVITPP